MLFSIIIPMYNLENYIQVTLESILQNDLSDCELLLIDDGSTDKTVEVAEALLKEKCPCYYAIIKKENTGASDTRNRGIQAATGQYLIFCDGDDFFEPGLLDNLRRGIEDTPDMVAWPYYILQNTEKKLSQKEGKEGNYTSGQMLKLHLLEGYRMRLGSFAVSRELLIQRNIFFTRECTFAEDMEFIMKCILNVKTVKWLSTPMFCYVLRSGSLVNSYTLKRFDAPRAIDRVGNYVREKGMKLDETLKEYMENGLFVLHYIYSLESCLLSLSTGKQGRILWKEIRDKYGDVESACRRKLSKMQKPPVGISGKRLQFLKISTPFYIQMRIIMKRITGE